MTLSEELKLLNKKYTVRLFFAFFIVNSFLLAYRYTELYLNIELEKFRAIINGIVLTNYYIWFIGLMTIPTILMITSGSVRSGVDCEKPLPIDREQVNVKSFYLYQLQMCIVLVTTFQLVVMLFLPITIIDTIKIGLTVLIINASYNFILLAFLLILKHYLVKEAVLLITYLILIYGFFIAPFIKIMNDSNKFIIRVLSWFDLQSLFSQFYFYIASIIARLSFAYTDDYMERVFHYIAINKLEDYDYYDFYSHELLSNPTWIIVLIILGLTGVYASLYLISRKHNMK